MSTLSNGIIGGAVGAALAAQGVVYRSIGGVVAPCTLSERHYDTLTITDHPVEIGAQITDHSFLNPVTVDIVIAWGAGLREPLRLIYEKLLKLQSSRQPFDINTGKRKYKSMLIESIEETTDHNTENMLRISLHCRQIIIVSTSVTPLPNAADQANPDSTASTQNRGTVQPAETFPYSSGSAVIGKPI